METIRILLIEADHSVLELLEKQLNNSDTVKFLLDRVEARDFEEALPTPTTSHDVIIFAESMQVSAVARLARSIRMNGIGSPILLLTRESEARVPARLQQAGVDDMLNVAEINTPVFWWSFMSILKQAELRKKAEEFDVIHDRLQLVNESLAFITHDINNPLSVIRLAVYNLRKPALTADKKELFFNLLIENVKKVDDQMKKLYEIRSQLGENANTLARILSTRETEDTLTL